MSLSTKERDRRYQNIRAGMERENLDVLVVYGNSGRQGPNSGNLAYVSNFIPFSGQQVLVFPKEGEPVLFVGVENQRIEAIRKSWISDCRCEAMTPVPEPLLSDVNVEALAPAIAPPVAPPSRTRLIQPSARVGRVHSLQASGFAPSEQKGLPPSGSRR